MGEPPRFKRKGKGEKVKQERGRKEGSKEERKKGSKEGSKEERKQGSKEGSKEVRKKGSKEGKRRILFEETCAFSHFCQSVFFRTMISFVFFFSQSFATMPRELCSKKSPFNPSLSF